MARNEAYQMVLKSMESFEGMYRQQPGNRAALERCRQKLGDALIALKQTAAANAAGGAKSNIGTGQAVTPPPKGPVNPSTVPPTPDQLEQQKNATEKKSHLPIPLGPAPRTPKSLERVPDKWVRSQCEQAEAQLAEVAKLLAHPEPNADAVRASLSRVRAALDRLNAPPKKPQATTPKFERS